MKLVYEHDEAGAPATILLKSRSSEVEASGLIIRRKGNDILLIA